MPHSVFKITEKNIHGAPDLVVEILSPSTAKKDCTVKLELYRKYGVKEYWIVDPENDEITAYYFAEKKQADFISEINEF